MQIRTFASVLKQNLVLTDVSATFIVFAAIRQSTFSWQTYRSCSNITNMSTISLSSLKQIPEHRQYTVSGYIRELESKSGHEIPREIILVCILFYGNDSDEWDTEYINSSRVILKDRTLRMRGAAWGSTSSCYGKKIVKSGIFSWRFKIEHFKRKKEAYGSTPMIGIWKVDKPEDKPDVSTWFTYNHAGYAFDPTQAILTGSNGFYDKKLKYGVICKKDSIIKMILDLNELSLGYVIDGVDYGKAFDVAKGEYRAAIFMRVDDSFTLLY